MSQELADPAARTADVAYGGQIYRLYCAGCHSATGRGGALTRGRNAPNIALYPPAEALAAMILGRGNMPVVRRERAGRAPADLGRAVRRGARRSAVTRRTGTRYLGPVPEGAVGAVALLILIFLAVWLAWKSREAAP